MLNAQRPVGVTGATPTISPDVTPSPTAEASPSPSPSDRPTPAPTASPSPTPAPAFALNVEHSGGLMGMDDFYAIMPGFVLLDDRRVILPADLTSGSRWPTVEVRELSESGVAAIRDLVDASGQLAADASWSAAASIVADAGGTTFTVRRGDSTVVVDVYELGAFTSGEAPASVPADELAAYRALFDLLEQLRAIDEWLSESGWAPGSAWEQHEPDAIRLFARTADADPEESDAPFVDAPWPTEVDPGWIVYPMNEWGEFRCSIATGDDLDAWRTALSDADELTRFVAEGHRYEVTVRLMLPDESAECPPPR